MNEGTSGGPPSRVRESHDYHVKVQGLKDKLDQMRDQVSKVRGIEVTKGEQIKRFQILAHQLVQKREILARYKNHCPIEGARSHGE